MSAPGRTKKRLSKRIAGSILRGIASRTQELPKLRPDQVRRILLIRYDRLGDMVITTPLIESIHRLAPSVEIDVLASWRNASLIENDPRINRVLRWDGPPWKRLRTLMACRKRRYDLTFQLILWRTTLPGLLAGMLTPHGRVVSRDDANNRDLFEHTYKVDSTTHYSEQVYGFLAAAFDLDGDVPEMPPYSLHIPKDAERSASDRMTAMGLAPNRYILLNISAGEPERELSEEQLARLLTGLTKQGAKEDLEIVITGGPGDREKATVLAENARETSGGRILPFFGSLPEALVIIRDARMIITPDTGTNHLASALDTPTVVYFLRNGRPIGWGPRVRRHRIVQATEGNDASAVSMEALLEATRSLLEELRTADTNAG